MDNKRKPKRVDGLWKYYARHLGGAIAPWVGAVIGDYLADKRFSVLALCVWGIVALSMPLLSWFLGNMGDRNRDNEA